MKAMILAAGEGTRLRPLTLETPKIMIPLAGKPLAEYIIDLLSFHGITEMAINLSHMPEVVMDRLGNGDRYGVNITYSVEETPLGTAGALTKLRDFLDDTFIVIYGDMLTDLDLLSLTKFHHRKNALASIALFEVEDPSRYGVVEIDSENRIQSFFEKPQPGITSSNLVNTGIYILEPELIDYIPEGTVYDFGYDLFPALLNKGKALYGYITSDVVLDAGTMENYRDTEQELIEGRFSPKKASFVR